MKIIGFFLKAYVITTTLHVSFKFPFYQMCLQAKDTFAIFSTDIFILRDGERCKTGKREAVGILGPLGWTQSYY